MEIPFPQWWTLDALPPGEDNPGWGLAWVEWAGSEPSGLGEVWTAGSPIWLQARARPTGVLPERATLAELREKWEPRLAESPVFIGDEALALLEQEDVNFREQAVPLREAVALVQPLGADLSWEQVGLRLQLPSPPEPGVLRAQWYGTLLLTLLEERARLPEALQQSLGRLLADADHSLAVGLPRVALFPLVELENLYSERLKGLAPPFAATRESYEPVADPVPLDPAEVAALLSPSGPIAQAHPFYEHREGQIRMARAVTQAFNEGHLLLVEAGTGTGKSIAYLVPALRWVERNQERVVISTNTKNLQDQLFEKDLPFLQRLLKTEVRAERIKGRNNYLCLRRLLDELQDETLFTSRAARLTLAYLLAWAYQHPTGDLDELSPFWIRRYPGTATFARSLASESDFCVSAALHEHPCFAEVARRRAFAAGLLVVNHALVMAHFTTPVLPPFQRLILDEAHNLEEVVTRFFGVEVSRRGLEFWLQGLAGSSRSLVGRLQRHLSPVLASSLTRLEEACAHCMVALDDFTLALYRLVQRRLQSAEELDIGVRWRIRDASFWSTNGTGLPVATENLGVSLTRVAQELAKASKAIIGAAETFQAQESVLAQVEVTAQAGVAVLEAWRGITTLARRDFVYWVEFQQRGARTDWVLHGAPIDTGLPLAQQVYNELKTVVLTSATLTIARRFDYFRERLGVALTDLPSEALRVPSHFPYDELVLLGIPTDMVLPDHEEFDEQVARLLYHLMEQIQGRTLVLFTSYRSLRYVHERSHQAIARLGVEVLCQGQEIPRHQLAERFRQGRPALLMGTRSFWEGIDVPGEALQCVVLVKLPFPVPSDPIVQARTEALNKQERDGYLEYYEPQAMIQFQQGFGRLVRTTTDRGAVLVLDRRLLLRPYGKRFLASAPGYRLLTAPAREILTQTRIWLEEGRQVAIYRPDDE